VGAGLSSSGLTDTQRLKLFGIAEELARLGHWRWDVRTDELYWSDEVFRIHGHEPQSFVPDVASAVDAYHPDDREVVSTSLATAVEAGRGFDFSLRIVNADGTIRDVRSLGYCETDDAGAVIAVFGVFQDQTERLAAERRLADEGRRLQLAADSADLAVWDIDLRTDHLVWDSRMFEIFGLDENRFGGRFADWAAVVLPEDLPAAEAAFARATAGVEDFDTRFRIRRPSDGSIRHIDANAIVVRDDAGAAVRVVGINRDVTDEVLSELRFQSLLDHLAVACLLVDEAGNVRFANATAGEMFGRPTTELVGRPVDALLPGDVAARVGRRADGSEFPIQLGTGVLETAEGPTRVLSITDLTEVRTLEQALVHAQRMEAMGQLAGGIAHDFNNLLGVFMGHAELLGDLTEQDPEASESVAAIRECVERGASLTQQLLAYSRRQPLAPRAIDVADVLQAIAPMLERTLGETVALSVRPCSTPCPVLADRHRLEDALVNLALNARHAMPGGGSLTITGEVRDLPKGVGTDGEQIEPGRYVAISVRDTGYGMSDEIRRRAFEPFFTTREVGAGSGLGLSMVHGFVRQSGGHVVLDSVQGRGTQVTLHLPAIDSSPDEAPGPTARPEDRTLRGRVLLVEDDAGLREVAESMLGDAGLEVLSAADAAQALALVADGARPDLLFSDVVLPGTLNGPALAERLEAQQPGLPVLFTTGYPNLGAQGDPVLPADAEVLQKPYGRRDLLERIGRLLASKAAAEAP
jgi:PAS domain S-box-containing protein